VAYYGYAENFQHILTRYAGKWLRQCLCYSPPGISETQRFNGFFSKWRPSAILDLWGRLVVSIVVQNLVEINAIEIKYLARLALKRLFRPQKWVSGGGDFILKMGSNIKETPKRHSLARVRVV